MAFQSLKPLPRQTQPSHQSLEALTRQVSPIPLIAEWEPRRPPQQLPTSPSCRLYILELARGDPSDACLPDFHLKPAGRLLFLSDTHRTALTLPSVLSSQPLPNPALIKVLAAWDESVKALFLRHGLAPLSYHPHAAAAPDPHCPPHPAASWSLSALRDRARP